ncbi:MAG: PhzF family phenazine biosynthesis protein, partial [Bdellovibrionales bacterium]|nr:PhzF family phenazine biosynthesis protein [Bdellovibrionales bacterium]
VTGVAHCVLTPYWSQKLSKRNLSAFQASRRTGFMDTELDGDRVILKGYAVTVMECKILIEWS